MLGVSDRIVDTLAVYRDEVSEYWYVNSQGTRLHELRPEVTLSGTAVARRDGTIERGSSRSGCAAAWNRGRTRPPGSARSRSGRWRRSAGRLGKAATNPVTPVPDL